MEKSKTPEEIEATHGRLRQKTEERKQNLKETGFAVTDQELKAGEKDGIPLGYIPPSGEVQLVDEPDILIKDESDSSGNRTVTTEALPKDNLNVRDIALDGLKNKTGDNTSIQADAEKVSSRNANTTGAMNESKDFVNSGESIIGLSSQEDRQKKDDELQQNLDFSKVIDKPKQPYGNLSGNSPINDTVQNISSIPSVITKYSNRDTAAQTTNEKNQAQPSSPNINKIESPNINDELPVGEYQTIAGERVIPGQPLSEKQQAAIQIKNEMSGATQNTPYGLTDNEKDMSDEEFDRLYPDFFAMANEARKSPDYLKEEISGPKADGKFPHEIEQSTSAIQNNSNKTDSQTTADNFKPNETTTGKDALPVGEYQMIAGERVIPGQPLSEKQQIAQQIRSEMAGLSNETDSSNKIEIGSSNKPETSSSVLNNNEFINDVKDNKMASKIETPYQSDQIKQEAIKNNNQKNEFVDKRLENNYSSLGNLNEIANKFDSKDAKLASVSVPEYANNLNLKNILQETHSQVINSFLNVSPNDSSKIIENTNLNNQDSISNYSGISNIETAMNNMNKSMSSIFTDSFSGLQTNINEINSNQPNADIKLEQLKMNNMGSNAFTEKNINSSVDNSLESNQTIASPFGEEFISSMQNLQSSITRRGTDIQNMSVNSMGYRNKPRIINQTSRNTNNTQAVPKKYKPADLWDKNNVPDPTPNLGSLAAQLFI